MGIERIQVGDLAVYYEDDAYIHFKELADQQLVMKQSLSIKRQDIMQTHILVESMG